MEISCLMDGCSRDGRGSQISRRFAWKTLAHRLGWVFLTLPLGGVATAQSAQLVLERDGRVISLEPYAANIVRSIDKFAATGAPGYGFAAKPSDGEWTQERDDAGNEVFRSPRMVLRVSPGNLPSDKLPQPMPLDALNGQLRRDVHRAQY
jgi:alpha-D-xyloside xylohydrolase